MTEQGDVLAELGRLEDAALLYERGIQHSMSLSDERQEAVGRAQLGAVRLLQERYEDALFAFHEAQSMFHRIGEPQMVLLSWRQIGRAHMQAGQLDAAEAALRRALALIAQLDDRSEAPFTLGELASVASALGRFEDEVAYLRQAADSFAALGDEAGEAAARSNLGGALLRLGRLEEARHTLLSASHLQRRFGHSAEPWKTWALLATVEIRAARPRAARAARRRAMALYQEYRLSGGEPMDLPCRLIVAFGREVRSDDVEGVRSLLAETADDPQVPPGVRAALLAIRDGSSDPAISEDPALPPTAAVELSLLLGDRSS